jgi:hypothetical protein
MPFNGMREVSFNVLIVRHLLIIKINLENILVPHNFYSTILTFKDKWYTAWCIFRKSFKFASKFSPKDLKSIDKSQLVCSNCAPCYTEVDQKACEEGHGSITFVPDQITITCVESFNTYYCTCGQSWNSALHFTHSRIFGSWKAEGGTPWDMVLALTSLFMLYLPLLPNIPMTSCLCMTWNEIANDTQLVHKVYRILYVIYEPEFLSEIFKRSVWCNTVLNDKFC